MMLPTVRSGLWLSLLLGSLVPRGSCSGAESDRAIVDLGAHVHYSCANCMSYAGYNVSAYIPFVTNLEQPPMQLAPELRISLFGSNYSIIMDTGSTGLIISASKIPRVYFDPMNAPEDMYDLGWEFLSSSKLLYVGYWVPAVVFFPDADVTSNVKVLAVTKEITCPGYNITGDTSDCPPAARPLAYSEDFGSDPMSPNGWLNGSNATDVPDAVNIMPGGILYLGVGFGRTWAGFPGGYPSRNVLLNVVSIGKEPVAYLKSETSSPIMRRGYIVNATGVTIGLTAENSGGLSLQKLGIEELTPIGNAPGWNGSVVGGSMSNWAEPRGCISIDDAICVPADILTDTGVAQSYIETGFDLPTVNVTNPSTQLISPGLPDGTRVYVDLNNIGVYEFEVGGDSTTTPSLVLIDEHHVHGANINTGRAFFRRFAIVYDAQGGYWGVIDGLDEIGKLRGKFLEDCSGCHKVEEKEITDVKAGEVRMVCG